MFKTWNLRCLRYSRGLTFGHLNFEDSKFVSDFDIRISNLFSARKDTNLRTKELYVFSNTAEAFPVNRAISKSANRSTMFFSAVPFILAKAKFWKLLVIKGHQSIPSYLGNDGRCRDAQTPPVTMFDDLLRDRRPNWKDTVNKQVIRRWSEIIHCHAHGQEGSLKDIDPVDFYRINNSYPNRDGLLIDRIKKLFSPLRAQSLGIIKMGEIKLLREDDCRSHDWAGQRAPSGLVNASNL